ncbi:MAG TPA: hypothetical protein VJS67_08330 [Pseudonocardiaceae bacterium]|nr:hypothetical protein [Pseudonocardiaceae bacterium]
MKGIALRYGAFYGQYGVTRVIINLVRTRRCRCPRPAAASSTSSTWTTPAAAATVAALEKGAGQAYNIVDDEHGTQQPLRRAGWPGRDGLARPGSPSRPTGRHRRLHGGLPQRALAYAVPDRASTEHFPRASGPHRKSQHGILTGRSSPRAVLEVWSWCVARGV